MKVNLLPTPSMGRRFFFWLLLLVLLWVSGLAVFAFWLYTFQEGRLAEARSKLARIAPLEREVRQQVREREAFMEEHGPALAYVEAVDRLKRERPNWSEAINALETSLPPSAQVFDLQARGNRMDGKGAFHTVNDVAFFTRMMEKNQSIASFSVDSIEKREAYPSLDVKPKKVWIVRFHFILDRMPSKGGRP